MSNNTPDYKDNLVFEPKQMDIEECIAKIGSQDELTVAGGRQSDVLIQAIEKCEKLEKENKQLTQFLEEFNALEIAEENERLKKQLKVAKKYLHDIQVLTILPDDNMDAQIATVFCWSTEATDKIEELERCKKN